MDAEEIDWAVQTMKCLYNELHSQAKCSDVISTLSKMISPFYLYKSMFMSMGFIFYYFICVQSIISTLNMDRLNRIITENYYFYFFFRFLYSPLYASSIFSV